MSDIDRWRDPTNEMVVNKDEYYGLRKRVEELQASADLRWNADLRGIKRWQEATGKELEWPDQAELIVFLLERLDAAELAEQKLEAVEKELADARNETAACHHLYDMILRLCGHSPEQGHPGVVDAVRMVLKETEELRGQVDLMVKGKAALEEELRQTKEQLSRNAHSLSRAVATSDERAAEINRLRREILAAGNSDFDWSVLERLDRIDAIKEWFISQTCGDVHALNPQILLWELQHLLDGDPLPKLPEKR